MMAETRVRQKYLDRLNWLQTQGTYLIGAARGRGFVDIADKDHDNEVKEAEQRGKMESLRKGSFTKRMFIEDKRKAFRMIEVGLTSMANSSKGEPVSFIPLAIVEKYGFGPVIEIPEMDFDTPSVLITCSQAVEITWMGKDRVERQDLWLILPKESGVRMPLLGEHFMVHHGDILFDTDDKGFVALAKGNKEHNERYADQPSLVPTHPPQNPYTGMGIGQQTVAPAMPQSIQYGGYPGAASVPGEHYGQTVPQQLLGQQIPPQRIPLQQFPPTRLPGQQSPARHQWQPPRSHPGQPAQPGSQNISQSPRGQLPRAK
ncbi:hypothetical protein QBC40DRAFT_298160 [Triangularia verruculosa]|uniref:Uncharacterized protein n=1 Tax=Triangularia verruculosa TaxID=2587418 RepID=A0AAN6XEQ2_9PEZI|nr:hypothetical protein QBC40DRAFT_298160 [Triangularia verruculosa]